MTLAHPELDTVFDFQNGKLNTLVIENPGFFFRFLQDIQWQLEGNTGDVAVAEHWTPVSVPKKVELLDHFISFDLNQKNLVTKIISALEKVAITETYYYRTTELLQQLELYVGELASEFSCDILCGKCGFSAILKAMKPEISDDSDSVLERLLNYMELVRDFDCEKLFIFVNLRAYFAVDELEQFLKTAINHDYQIFLVDNREYPCYTFEKRVVIDEDLCEI